MMTKLFGIIKNEVQSNYLKRVALFAFLVRRKVGKALPV